MNRLTFPSVAIGIFLFLSHAALPVRAEEPPLLTGTA